MIDAKDAQIRFERPRLVLTEEHLQKSDWSRVSNLLQMRFGSNLLNFMRLFLFCFFSLFCYREFLKLIWIQSGCADKQICAGRLACSLSDWFSPSLVLTHRCLAILPTASQGSIAGDAHHSSSHSHLQAIYSRPSRAFPCFLFLHCGRNSWRKAADMWRSWEIQTERPSDRPGFRLGTF